MNKDKYYILWVALLISITSYFLSGPASLVIIFCLASYIIYKNSSLEDRKFILTVLIVGFLLRVIAASALHILYYLKGFGGATSGDDLLYTVKGWALVNKWEAKPYLLAEEITGSSFQFGINPFTCLLAVFYKLYGFHPLAAKMINCIVGTLMGWVSYLLGKEMFDRKTAKISMLIVTFYPSLVRWSAANLKDPMVILLFMVCIYIIIDGLYNKVKIWKLIVLAIAMGLLYYFVQIFYFVLVVGSLAVSIFFRSLGLFSNRTLRMTFVVSIALLVIVSFYYLFFLNPQKIVEFIYMCEEQQFIISRSDYAGYYFYPRDFMEDLNKGIVSVLKLSTIAFIDIVFFLLTPFPWQMASRERILVFPQMLAWYAILILSILGYAKLIIRRPRIAFSMGALLVVGITVNSLAEGNIGAAFRHRDIYTPFFVILASVVMSDLIKDIKKKISKYERDTHISPSL